MKIRSFFRSRKFKLQVAKEQKFTSKFNYILSLFVLFLGITLCTVVLLDARKSYAETPVKTETSLPITPETVRDFTTNHYAVWKIVHNKSIDPLVPFLSDVLEMQPGAAGQDVHHTTRWKNYIIQNNYKTMVIGNASSVAGTKATHLIDSILMFDIETRETLSVRINDLGEAFDTVNTDYFNLQIVGNRAYFGYGDSNGARLTHYLNLPLTKRSKPAELKQSPGAAIEKYKGMYFGSTCNDGCLFTVVDPSSNVITQLPRASKASKIDSAFSEEYLGLTSLGGEIFTVFNDTHETIEELVAAPYEDEKSTIMLINKSRMPEGITRAELHPDYDQVILVGSAVYLYEIKKDILTEIPNSEVKAGTDLISFNSDIVCFNSKAEQESDWYLAVNVITKESMSEVPEACREIPVAASVEDLITKQFQSLNLPTEYSIMKEDRFYETYTIR